MKVALIIMIVITVLAIGFSAWVLFQMFSGDYNEQPKSYPIEVNKKLELDYDTIKSL